MIFCFFSPPSFSIRGTKVGITKLISIYIVAVETTNAHTSLAYLYGHIHHKHCPCPKTVTLQTVSSTLAAPSIHHGPVAAGTTRGAEYGQHRCLWHGWHRGAATMLQGYWKRVKAAKKLIRRLSCLTMG